MLTKDEEVKIVEYYFTAAREALAEVSGDDSMENSLYHALDFIAEDITSMRDNGEDLVFWYTKVKRGWDDVKQEVVDQSRKSNY